MSKMPWPILGLSALLVGELEYLLVTNYDARTAIRGLLHLPLYHILLTFFALNLMAGFLSGKSPRSLQGWRLSVPVLCVHLAGYGLLCHWMPVLWANSELWPDWQATAFWLLLGVLFMGTWLGSWMSPRAWLGLWQGLRTWWALTLPASLALPEMAEVVSSNWKHFAWVTFWFSSRILAIFYPEVVSSVETLRLGTPDFVIEIEAGCSGYEGIALVGGLTTFYLWLKRRELRFPNCLWLVFWGIAASWWANILRIVLLVFIGAEISPEIAVRGFHSQAGWISFTVIGLSLVYLAESCNWFREEKLCNSEYESSYPGLPYLGPFMALIVGTVLAEAVRVEFNTYYFLKPVFAIAAFLAFNSGQALKPFRPTWLAGAVGIVVYFLWIAMERTSRPAPPQEFLQGFWLSAWLAVRVFGSVVVVPIVEELAFRGYLLRRLQAQHFEKVDPRSRNTFALGVSSLVFGLIHGNWLGGFFAGIFYGWVSTRPGGLANAIVAHLVTNLMISCEVLLLDHWWLWD